jgi:hypothetical protein
MARKENISTDRVGELQALCAELYQVLGTVGAPVRVLDKVAAAAAGKPIPDVDLLPIAETEFDEVRERQAAMDDIAKLLAPRYASLIGRVGGKSTSEAKRAAVRENGKKGGRPRKTVRA